MHKRNLFLSAISGLLLAQAMPRPGLWPLAWVALVPLFVSLREATIKRAALYGLTAGVVYFGFVLFWMTIFGYLPWLLLAVVEASFLAVFAAGTARLLPARTGWPSYIAVPAAWTAVQWLRSLGPYSFTWGSLAHLQANDLPIIQLASVTGPWGIDFLICLVNLALADLLIPHNHKRRIAPTLVAGVVTAVVALAGWSCLRADGPPARTRVAVIQGDTVRGMRPTAEEDPAAAFEVYRKLSLRAAKSGPDIVVWPETSLIATISDPGWGTLVSLLARSTSADYLIGGYDAAPGGGYYNGAHLYRASGEKTGVYRKVRLVPYGEFVPLRDRLPFLKRYGIRDVDVTPGASHKLLQSSIGPIGVSICFESIFPQISSAETRAGGVALFVITNDSWFERSQAARQHLMMSKLRAVENRRYVVRAASTGISAIIDPSGRTGGETGLFEKAVLRGTIAARTGLTPYARFGDCFAYACALIALIALVADSARRKRDYSSR